ncbi:MAG: hypothetical protein K5634_02350, partial [Sphaerochaetaceae bacterium]|nr:hypothetical protein [Sphaerochaetaceae bacterium]
GSDLPDLSLTWFMDGEEIEGQNGGTLEFLPCSGWHIINAVIVSPSLGLSGSVGWKFEALSNAAQGTAVYNGEVSSFVSDPSSLIGAVGDDRFIVLCPSQGLLQVLKVYNNTLITESVVRETDEGFSWLSLSDGLYSSALMNEFAITDSGKNINLLYLDDGVIRQCTLQAENIRYEGYALGEKFSPLEYAWADGTNSVIGFSCFENAILVLKFENGAVIHQSRCLKPRNNNDLLFVMSGGNLGLCANTAGEFFSCGFTENRFSGTWKKSGVEAFYTTPVTIAASRYIAETSSGSLCLWVPGTNRWQHRGTSDISPVCLSAGTGVGYLYAMTAEGKLTTFSLSDSGMRKINILDTSMKVNSLIAGSRSLLGVRSDGSLVLFSIAGGDK